jgi:acyl-CoA thioesterase
MKMDTKSNAIDFLKNLFERVNSEDTFARQIGMKLIEVQPGFARAILPVTKQTINIHQIAHGGAIFSVADQACEAAGNSFGAPAVALQNSIHFLNSGKPGDFLEGTARIISRSNRIGLIEFEVKNQEGLLLAQGHQLIYFKSVK